MWNLGEKGARGHADGMWDPNTEYKPVSKEARGFFKVGSGLLAIGLLAWPIFGHSWSGPTLLGLVALVVGFLEDLEN